MITAAEALAAQLESLGVEYVFGTCGHTNIALLDALSRSTIRFVIARHEQAAAHAADGYARVSGKPGVLLLHVGPGMMNAVTGVATAALDSVPLVAISGDVPSYYAGRHPHQEINLHADADQTAIYRPFTKRTWHVHRAEDLPRFTERAFWTATSGRPGAVLVNVPMDIFSRPAPAAPAYPLPADAGRPGLPADVAERIAGLLVEAERPLIYIGGGLRDPAARAALAGLAEHLDIPIAHSLMAKGAVPDDHPLLLGMTGFWGLELANGYAREADVVLALGTRFAETDASSWHPDYTWRFPPSRLIQIDIDPAEIGRSYPVEIGAVADTALAVDAVAEGGQPGPFGARITGKPAGARSERPGPAPSRRPGSRAAATPSRCGRSGSWPTCGTRCRPTRCWSPTWAGTRTAWRSATNCPPQGRFITPGGASTMGFGPAAAVGIAYSRSRTDGGGSGRRRRDERAMAGAADGRRAGAAGDLRGDEQPRPRDHRRPGDGQLRQRLRLRVPRPRRPPVQPGLRRPGAGVRRRRLSRSPLRTISGRRCVRRCAGGDARPCSTCR